jgi:translation initiation factor IF-1
MLKKNRSIPRLIRISLSSGTIPRTNLPYVVLRMQSPVYYMQEGMTFAFTDASSANVLVVEAKFPKGQMHRIWIRQSDHAIVKVELFDKSGALYRTLVKNNIVTSNGHWFANTITVSDPEGQVTTITVLVRRDADEDGRFNQSEASRLCR